MEKGVLLNEINRMLRTRCIGDTFDAEDLMRELSFPYKVYFHEGLWQAIEDHLLRIVSDDSSYLVPITIYNYRIINACPENPKWEEASQVENSSKAFELLTEIYLHFHSLPCGESIDPEELVNVLNPDNFDDKDAAVLDICRYLDLLSDFNDHVCCKVFEKQEDGTYWKIYQPVEWRLETSLGLI